ncbi:PiggyBac transposable element-derived protein [Trichinella pseudospiralis]
MGDSFIAACAFEIGSKQIKHNSTVRCSDRQFNENNLDEVTSEDVCGELDVTVVHDDYKSNSESIDALPVERTSWKRRTCFSSDLEKIEDIADESQRYALQKGVNFEVYVQDIMQFFGLILLRGNLLVPNENYFWSTEDDVCVSIVFKSMVPYYGHHCSRMFICGKPIRLGQQIWAMTFTSGYSYKLEFYSGVTGKTRGPFGTRVIKRIQPCVKRNSEPQVLFKIQEQKEFCRWKEIKLPRNGVASCSLQV